MTPEQTMEPIAVETLLQRVQKMHEDGYRLVQIHATTLPDKLEITYSFDLDLRLASLRLHLPLEEPRLPSVSTIYGCAVLYENEMHDLFRVQVDGMTLDFKGNLYKTAVKFPFGSTKAPGVTCAAIAPAPTPKPAAGAAPVK